MSFLTTTTNLHHRTPLPPSTTSTHAISQIHNHDLLIHLDPELAHYETLPPPSPNPRGTKYYKVTDHMHTLPRGLWDTTVTFEAQITDTADGVEWVIKAPLGLVQTTTWRILKAGEGDVFEGEEEEGKAVWCLVEDVEIKASRLLVGTVKGKCEDNWRGIHGRFVKSLGEAEGNAESLSNGEVKV